MTDSATTGMFTPYATTTWSTTSGRSGASSERSISTPSSACDTPRIRRIPSPRLVGAMPTTPGTSWAASPISVDSAPSATFVASPTGLEAERLPRACAGRSLAARWLPDFSSPGVSGEGCFVISGLLARRRGRGSVPAIDVKPRRLEAEAEPLGEGERPLEHLPAHLGVGADDDHAHTLAVQPVEIGEARDGDGKSPPQPLDDRRDRAALVLQRARAGGGHVEGADAPPDAVGCLRHSMPAR